MSFVRSTVANVRTDTKAVLGVVGRRYRVFQNHEAFDFMDALVGDKLAMYETAGSLHGGKRTDIFQLGKMLYEMLTNSDPTLMDFSSMAPGLAQIIRRAATPFGNSQAG
jgi:serine/threonine protein kinase